MALGLVKRRMALLAVMAVVALRSTPLAEAQVYAYEEDFDRGYPGAGPYGYYHNICNFECPDVWSPVCATDGYSYPSGCHLFVASCWKQILGQKGTSFWYRGTCLIEGATDYDPQPGLKKREEEERQRKIDAGEWVPTTPPTDAIYINGRPYLPPYNPPPTDGPGEASEDRAGAEDEEEDGEEGEDAGTEAEGRVERGGGEDAPAMDEGVRSDGFVRDDVPIESRRRRRRSVLDMLKLSPPRRQRRRRRHHDCHWACPLTPAPLCASDGKTHFNKCHFLRLKCRVDAAKIAAAAAAAAEAFDAGNDTAVDAAARASDAPHTSTAAGELVIRHGGKCGRFADAADERVRDCVTQCGMRAEDHMMKPICASNGKTYPNFCFYQQAKCLAYLNNEVDINFFKMGFCNQ